ncbi:hypothetical protein NQ314_007288 [Rhamnusium bicolor]|uniref:Receptor ligand binding region domain-containing protein n=1 Tax=Rhamnusium bicolor TaxID=1586634 RepID=A0AAV8YS83_9CUCU|nr:hypothetical protein NQ314_007288 [Rhamnusium bicolor]
MILEDLMPDVKILEIDGNDFVDDTVDYFRKKHITLLALTDLLGGYLQHAVLPIARQAYYAGIIDYLSMEKLIQLFEELKWFLRTNGQGWSMPIESKNEFDIQSIDFQGEGPKSNKSCCRNLIYYQHEPSKKRSVDKSEQSLFFPLPFFDSKVRPAAIAVPFKKFALRNIESKKAAYLVMKYYISAYRCLNDLHADADTIGKFQDNMFTWVEKDVIPKLGDDKFYSAFGGIMRVEETLKSMGAKINKDGTCEIKGEAGDEELGVVPGGESSTRSSMVLMGMLITIFVWFIIGTLFICYRIRANSLKAAQLGQVGFQLFPKVLPNGKKNKSDLKTLTNNCCIILEHQTHAGVVQRGLKNPQFPAALVIMKRNKKRHLKKYFPTEGKQTCFKVPPMCYPPSKKQQSYSSPSCMCDSPAIIETKHSMKVLPSIPEISENSSTKKEDSWKNRSRRISFEHPLATSSLEDVSATHMDSMSSKIKVCVPKLSDAQVTLCPHYSDKGTSLSRFDNTLNLNIIF